MSRGWMAAMGAMCLLFVWLAHPVCVPLADDDLKSFTPIPIEQRQDRDIFLFRTFQRRDGHWCQCKSWISRQLFF